jgi:hypothetical protein
MLRCTRALLLLLAARGLLISCNDTTGTCPPRALRAAVDVEIREAGTNLPLAATARETVRDGAYVDSLRPGRQEGDALVSRQAAFERPGTYTVEVVHPGYTTWQRTGVVAHEGTCGAETVTLQAILEPAS